jgi:glycosyltransferase involved in cell wall biosynthesis
MSQLVSIALCTYNGARFLRPQMDSLLAQTHQDIEILVADDCSTDGTVELLHDYAARDTRIRVYINECNLGHKKNFETLIARCRGDFIAPCDQDDVWHPDKLRLMLAAIGDKLMVYCDSELIDADDRPLGIRLSDHIRLDPIDDPLILLMRNCVSGHAMLFRQALLADALPFADCFDYHDWFLAALAAASGGIAYCDQPLVRYRMHADNVTDILGRKTQKRTRRNNRQLLTARTRTLASVTGPHKNLLTLLNRLAADSDMQWLSPRLGMVMIQHGARFRKLVNPPPQGWQWRYAHYMLGGKIKRLLGTRADAPHP